MSSSYLDPEVFPETEAGDAFRYRIADAKPLSDTVPSGTYVVRIVDAEAGYTEEKHLPRWRISFQVIAGEHDGRRLTKTYALSDKARPFFDGLVLATERFADDDDLDAAEVRDRLVGAEVALVVGIEESAEWGAQNRIRQAFPLSSPRGRRAAEQAGYDSRLP
jgi:hypothetical protein